jgi:acyl-[acyl-carrier-protein] desaturase
MARADALGLEEIDAERPAAPVGLLSRVERDTLIERGLIGLYRWYVTRSQAARNWNPDQSFDWRHLRTDHSPQLNTIIEGFFAVEQYVPDYTRHTLTLARRSYGQANFQIRWGAEEEKHADAWQNALLFLRFRSPAWIRQYRHQLRTSAWSLPWDDAFHMVIYALFQERATELNYLNTAIIARGKSRQPGFEAERDPVLANVAATIAADEAAHYHFFLEVTRLYLYYYPLQTLDAIHDVVEHFVMPGMDLLPNIDELAELLLRSGIYGPRQYAADVIDVVLSQLGIGGRRALVRGVRRSRQTPRDDGVMTDTSLFDALDRGAVELAVERVFRRIEQYEREVGLADVDPTHFVPVGDSWLA